MPNKKTNEQENRNDRIESITLWQHFIGDEEDCRKCAFAGTGWSFKEKEIAEVQ